MQFYAKGPNDSYGRRKAARVYTEVESTDSG